MPAVVPAVPRRAAVTGLLCGVLGVLSYFVVVFRLGAWLPGVRNDALPNLALVGVGLALSAVGARRALGAPAGTRGRGLGLVLGTANVALAAAFSWLLYGMSAMPSTAGPTVGAPAPDFALVDQAGHTVRLADFRGRPLLLVFYRGHW